MKFFCIGDEDTVAGFRLAGIAARVAATPEQTQAAVAEAAVPTRLRSSSSSPKNLQTAIRPQIEAIRLERERPLIVEIPGPEGPLPGRKSLREFVQEAVGMRICLRRLVDGNES